MSKNDVDRRKGLDLDNGYIKEEDRDEYISKNTRCLERQKENHLSFSVLYMYGYDRPEPGELERYQMRLKGLTKRYQPENID